MHEVPWPEARAAEQAKDRAKRQAKAGEAGEAESGARYREAAMNRFQPTLIRGMIEHSHPTRFACRAGLPMARLS